MKKISYFLISILSFISVSIVHADTLNASNYFASFDNDISLYLDNTQDYNSLLSFYQDNYSSYFPYYYITIDELSNNNAAFTLVYSKENNLVFDSDHSLSFDFSGQPVSSSGLSNFDNYDYGYINIVSGQISETSGFNTLLYSNSRGPLYTNIVYNLSDPILFPSFNSSSFDLSFISFEISSGDYFPSYLALYNGTYERNMFEHYTEINLNNYAYVALSLKDYTLRNDNINQFSTNIYTKGQLCLTPVYNYGMKEKVDYYSGYQIDRCSVVYDDFTPVRTYILKQDLENNAIYYLKAYDTSIENKVKIDTSVFDITYITQENANNPSVNVNGRYYPTIAYDDLSSSSTESEEEGYISGQSSTLLDQFDDNFINDFFSNPLKIFKSVWGAIASMLSLVTMFISLLPTTLQSFLYMSFALAIILGIIKILL